MPMRIRVLRKSFGERNQALIGLVGSLVVVALLLVAFNYSSLPGVDSGTSYGADFPEAGAIASGDDVLVAGRPVGSVSSVSLVDYRPAADGKAAVEPHVHVSFKITDDGVRLGGLTRAKIITETVLGKAAMEVVSAGSGSMPSGATVPMNRTSSPYDITQALSTLTTKTGEISTGTLSEALSTVSSQFKNTPTQLRTALEGVSRISQTISGRDAQLQALLANTASLSGLLSARNKQVTTLLQDGQSVLAILVSRKQEITTLLTNALSVSAQVHQLVTTSGKDLTPALTQLNNAVALLNRNKTNLEKTIEGLLGYVGGLGGAVSSGPFFDALVQNLNTPISLVPGVSALPCVLTSLNLATLLGASGVPGCQS